MSENKFVMGEEDDGKDMPEDSPSPTGANETIAVTATAQHKKPMRHHVKRRSSGRVHVAKLAPMTRSNSNNFIDTEVNSNDDTTKSRPTMRRSQSNRSLHKMSVDRRGFTAMTPRRKSTSSSEKLAAFQVVSSLPTPSSSTKHEITSSEPRLESTAPVTHNPASLSSTAIAEPVEQTFNALANNLVIPKSSDFPKISPDDKKQPLFSQFVSDDERPRSMSRTQQKLMLQKQQSLSEDENNPSHPRNMTKLNKEFDMIGREYRYIRKYTDPMLSSLQRCMEKLSKNHQNPQISRLQLGASQHSISTTHVPQVNKQPSPHIPHLEQRHLAHRYHHLKSVALSRAKSQPSIKQENHHALFSTFPWNATTFIDRLFSSNSTEN